MSLLSNKVEYKYLRGNVSTSGPAGEFMEFVNEHAEAGWYIKNSGQVDSHLLWVLLERVKD